MLADLVSGENPLPGLQMATFWPCPPLTNREKAIWVLPAEASDITEQRQAISMVVVVFSHVQPPWTSALQAPLFMGFYRQEYWNGLPFPSSRWSFYSWAAGEALIHDETESESCSVVFNSLPPHRLYSPWKCLGQNTGVGSLSLLQQIFPIQESNRGLLHCRRILYPLSYQGSPYSWYPMQISDSLNPSA